MVLEWKRWLCPFLACDRNIFNLSVTQFLLETLELIICTFPSRAHCLGSPWYNAWLERDSVPSDWWLLYYCISAGNTRRSQTWDGLRLPEIFSGPVSLQ